MVQGAVAAASLALTESYSVEFLLNEYLPFFLLLAAQYESWALPLAVILIVPMCLLSALLGLWMVSLGINRALAVFLGIA